MFRYSGLSLWTMIIEVWFMCALLNNSTKNEKFNRYLKEITMEEQQVHALGMFDAFKLLDKELIEKILAISKTVTVTHLDNGMIRVSVDLAINKD